MNYHDYVTRRWFFKECGVGLGTIALHSLLHDRAARVPMGTPPPAIRWRPGGRTSPPRRAT